MEILEKDYPYTGLPMVENYNQYELFGKYENVSHINHSLKVMVEEILDAHT
jgi:hypothetical protein